MGVATIGAFAIGEYPEGVTVMLFYAIGEVFQTLAVIESQEKRSSHYLIKDPMRVTVIRNNLLKTVKAETVEIDEIIR
jgi:Cd2+/Zn2+-exporting ATPase